MLLGSYPLNWQGWSKSSNVDILFHSPVLSSYPKAVKSWFVLEKGDSRVSYFLNSMGVCPRDEIYQVLADKLNTARELVLKENYDYLFSVDADIVLPKNALIRLLSWNRDIVSGLWRLRPSRGANSVLCARTETLASDGSLRFRFIEKDKDFTPGQLIKCATIGTSCLLMSRKALRDLKFFADGEGAFVKRAKEKGYDSFVDTGVKCIHLEPTGEEIRV